MEPVLRLLGVGGIDREPLDQLLTRFGRDSFESLKMWPRRLGVDMVKRHRGDASPIIDSRGD